jgi:quercetin dioxygenase-like cupin family protein
MKKNIHETSGAKKDKGLYTCDWRHPDQGKAGRDNTDKIYRHKGGCRWGGVGTERYKQQDAGWSSITRKVLIGKSGESAKFHLRYFEIAPKGFSSREKHRHEHVVICIRGKGRVLIGDRPHTIKHLDTVYLAPNTVHQLSNPYDEPFGFFCIVNAKRDKPKLVK